MTSDATPVKSLFDDASLTARLQHEGVLPVVVIERASDAVPVADALADGGCSLIEITLRTDAALDAIAALANHASIVVGAGTVLNAVQALAARDAGARFFVAPGLDEDTVLQARSWSVPMIPGIATATELQTAVNLGLTLVKFFPASSLGGPAAVKALSSINAGMRFLPTGGIRAEDLAAYRAVPAVIACGGTWIAAPELIAAADWLEIARRAAAARQG